MISEEDKHAVICMLIMVSIVGVITTFCWYLSDQHVIAEIAHAKSYVASHNCKISNQYFSVAQLQAYGTPYLCPNGQTVWVRE